MQIWAAYPLSCFLLQTIFYKNFRKNDVCETEGYHKNEVKALCSHGSDGDILELKFKCNRETVSTRNRYVRS